MTFSDVVRKPKNRVVCQFGILCLVVLVAAGVWQIFEHGRTWFGWILIGLGVVCLVGGLCLPRAFRWVYTGSMMAVFPIGFVVSQVVLLLLFYLLFLPIGMYLRLRNWDPMLIRSREKPDSFWETRQSPDDPGRYLRQY